MIKYIIIITTTTNVLFNNVLHLFYTAYIFNYQSTC